MAARNQTTTASKKKFSLLGLRRNNESASRRCPPRCTATANRESSPADGTKRQPCNERRRVANRASSGLGLCCHIKAWRETRRAESRAAHSRRHGEPGDESRVCGAGETSAAHRTHKQLVLFWLGGADRSRPIDSLCVRAPLRAGRLLSGRIPFCLMSVKIRALKRRTYCTSARRSATRHAPVDTEGNGAALPDPLQIQPPPRTTRSRLRLLGAWPQRRESDS